MEYIIDLLEKEILRLNRTRQSDLSNKDEIDCKINQLKLAIIKYTDQFKVSGQIYGKLDDFHNELTKSSISREDYRKLSVLLIEIKQQIL